MVYVAQFFDYAARSTKSSYPFATLRATMSMPVFREIGWCEEWPAAVTRVVAGLKNFSLVSNDGVEVAVPTDDTDAGSLSAAAFPLRVCLHADAELMVHGESVHFDFSELAALKQGLLLEGHPKVEKNVPAADGHAQSEKVAPLQSPKRRMVEENVVRIGDQPKDGAEQPKKVSQGMRLQEGCGPRSAKRTIATPEQ